MSDSSSTAYDGGAMSDTCSSDGVVAVVPLCSCRQQYVCTLVWVNGEAEARCLLCLNRVHLRGLSPADRFAYVCLLALWRAQFCRRA